MNKIDYGRVGFLFYYNWKDQLELLDDEQVREFIYNLIKWHKGEEIVLNSKIEQAIWNGVLPALETNNKKYVARAEASRKNGKLGGRPRKNVEPKKPTGFSENPENLIKDNSKEISDNREKVIDNRKEEIDNREEVNDDSLKKTENIEQEISIGEVLFDNTNQEIGKGIETIEKTISSKKPEHPKSTITMNLNTGKKIEKYPTSETVSQEDFSFFKELIENNRRLNTEDRIEDLFVILESFQKYFKQVFGNEIWKLIKEDKTIQIDFTNSSKHTLDLIYLYQNSRDFYLSLLQIEIDTNLQ